MPKLNINQNNDNVKVIEADIISKKVAEIEIEIIIRKIKKDCVIIGIDLKDMHGRTTHTFNNVQLNGGARASVSNLYLAIEYPETNIFKLLI